MLQHPSGTVTFLFTEIEGSTQLWEQHPAAMRAAIPQHDAILKDAVEKHAGYVVKTTGVGLMAAFGVADNALRAALESQQALASATWGETGALRVRMGLHTGSAEEREGDYFGPALNRAARLMAVGHGGQVLLSMGTCELVRDHLPPRVTLRDLGEHRLKDLARPEHIYQLVAPDLPSDFPPLKTLDNRPNNLPVQRDPLIGREKEVATLHALLVRHDVGLVTLTGPGGTGKTRLAVQVAADLLDQFEHGAYFVDLAPTTDPSVVVSTIAQTLGVQDQAARPLLDTLKDYLRGKQMLLVFDNFEQIVAAAPLIAELLTSAPKLKALVTSRIVLHLRGEQEFPVPPLPVPDPKHLPPVRSLSQYGAIDLFIQRAGNVKPDFAVTTENAPAIAEICYRLDGLPLAIELAAARIKVFPPTMLLERLDSRLKVLTGGARDLPARQQTLRGAIDWSYNLLDDGEKMVFRRLGIFVGGCTLEAAEAVCNAEGSLTIDLMESVASLVDKSLLRPEEQPDGAPRFRMLETIREYALERLVAMDYAAAVQHVHALFFLRLIEQAEPKLHGPEQRDWFSRLTIEQGNFAAALRWASTTNEAALALTLVGRLATFWRQSGAWAEGLRWLTSVLALPNAASHPYERGLALLGAGQLDLPLNESAREQYAGQSVQAWRELDDPRGLALALAMRGGRPQSPDRLAETRPMLEEAVALARGVSDPWALAWTLRGLGVAALFADPTTAQSALKEAVTILRSIGDRWDSPSVLTLLSLSMLNTGDLPHARALAEEALATQREIGRTPYLALILNRLGDIARMEAQPERAIDYYHEALALYRELGEKQDYPATLHNLGYAMLAQGDVAQAHALFVETVSLQQGQANRGGVVEGLTGLAAVASLQGQAEPAVRLLGAVEAAATATGIVRWPAEHYEWQRYVAATQTQLDAATWARAWAEGQAMTLEQAVAYALQAAPTDG